MGEGRVRGKLFSWFVSGLTAMGYYRGMLHSVDVVKAAIKAAKDFIQHLGQGAGFIEKIK